MASEMSEQELQEVDTTNNTEENESGQEVATLDDPELLIKHPLENKWALWFFKNDKSKDWKDNLKLVTTFDTVEDFWALYNHIQPASKLPPGCDYSLFKDGIQPMWEDDQNKTGGRWLINLDKRQRQKQLDNFWLEMLLCLIGEAFEEYTENVNGAVVNIRGKGDKLALWTGDARNGDATVKVGRKLKERLNIPHDVPLGYQTHTDTAVRSGSVTRSKFTV